MAWRLLCLMYRGDASVVQVIDSLKCHRRSQGGPLFWTPFPPHSPGSQLSPRQNF